MLHQEKKKTNSKEFSSMTIEELNSIIDKAENDRLYHVGEILKDIDTWE